MFDHQLFHNVEKLYFNYSRGLFLCSSDCRINPHPNNLKFSPFFWVYSIPNFSKSR